MSEVRVLKHQDDFIFSEYKNTALVAGYGSGKSFTATLKTILEKMKYPTVRMAYYLPTYPLIRDIAFIKFPEMCDMLDINYTLNKSDKELHLEGYGSILFRNMSDPSTIVGYEVGYSIIDECDIMDMEKMEDAYNKIMARNRSPLPDGSDNKLDIVGTPEGFRWFYKRVVQNLNPETDLLIRASTFDNKHLPTSYIDNLSNQYTPELLQAYLHGHFVNLTSGSVYKYFNRDTHVSRETVLALDNVNYYEDLHIGQDFNIGGCVSIVLVYRSGVYHAVNEIVAGDTYEVVDKLNALYPNNRIIIYPDASGRKGTTNASKSDIKILEDGGFEIEASASNPRITDRVNSMNKALQDKKLMVNVDKCPQLTLALEQQAYDKNGKPEKFDTHPAIDDYCFSGDTKVIVNDTLMRFDEIPSEGVVKGHNGENVNYIKGGLIGTDTLLKIKLDDGSVIRATPDHKFLTLDGWVSAYQLKGKSICKSRLYQTISNASTDTTTIKGLMDTTIRLWESGKSVLKRKLESQYIEKCINSITENLKMGLSYITLTKINQTIRLATYRNLHTKNIDNITPMSGLEITPINIKRESRSGTTELKNGTGAIKVENGIKSTMKTLNIYYIKKSLLSVKFVEKLPKLLKALARATSTALESATQKREEIAESITSKESATFVESYLRLTNTQKQRLVVEVVDITQEEKEKVYCLTVPKYGCFSLANGEIVSNCDSTGYVVFRLMGITRQRAKARSAIGTAIKL